MISLLLITLTAFIAGALNAIAGGGTFLTFPALTGFGGLEALPANMTSTIGLWPGSAASVVQAKSEFRFIPRGMLIAFTIISIVGGGVGAILLRVTSQHAFNLALPWLMGFATGVFAFSKPIAKWAGRQHGHRSVKWTVFVGAIQFLVAIYGGYFGAGIGVLMLAGLAFAGLDSLHQMNALKVLLATIINGVAAFIFLFSPIINWKIVALMAISSIFGGFWGMAVARKVPENILRLAVLATGLILTVVYFHKAYA